MFKIKKYYDLLFDMIGEFYHKFNMLIGVVSMFRWGSAFQTESELAIVSLIFMVASTAISFKQKLYVDSKLLKEYYSQVSTVLF